MVSRKPTIQQILSDPRSADRVALDYCAGEMTNCLKRTDELEGIVQQAYAMTAKDRVRISQQRARIAELELANQALREFVAANDKHESFRETVPTDGYELWIAEWEHLKREAWKARQRLATEHGLPLPEVER